MTGKDEFDYGENLPHGLGDRVIAGLVTTVFLTTTFGTGITDALFPIAKINLIGEESNEQARLKDEATLWDGSLARYYEGELRMRSRVRSWVLPQYSYMKYVYFDEAPPKVTIGKQHWMFLTRRISLANQSDEFLATSAANAVVALDRRLRGNGVEFTLIPLPRKSWVAREWLPRDVDGRQAVDDLLIEELKARGVSTVDLREPYRALDPEEIYFKTDDHWTPNGARIAAMETARFSGLLEPEAARLGQLQVSPPEQPYYGGCTTLRSIGVRPSRVDLDVLDLREPLITHLSFEPDVEHRIELSPPRVSRALAGTSFSNQQLFAGLLSHYSGAAIFDGARPALPFMSTVQGVLEAYAEGETKLERLFWEVPLATFYNSYSARSCSLGSAYGGTFWRSPPEIQLSFQQVPPAWMGLIKGELTTLSNERFVILHTPAGALAHSGDGVIALHLSGEVRDGPLLLTLINDRLSFDLHLEPGEFDAVLPIIAQGPTAAKLRLVTRPRQRARLRIDDARIVHQPVSHSMHKLMRQRPATLATFVPPSSLQLGARTALGIRTERVGNPLREFVVELHTTGATSLDQVTFERLLPGGWIVLDLGRHAGERLTGVTLRSATGKLKVRSVTITGAQ